MKLSVKISLFTKCSKWKCVQCEKQIVSSVKYQSRESVLSVKCVVRFEENSEKLYLFKIASIMVNDQWWL